MFWPTGQLNLPGIDPDISDDLVKDMDKAELQPPLQLADYMENGQQLAKMIYEFWVSTMETDQLEFVSLVKVKDDGSTSEERIIPSKFADLPAEVRINLVESIETNLTKPLKKIVQDLAYDRAQMDAIIDGVNQQQSGPPVDQAVPVFFPCYCCGKKPVGSPGHACDSCLPRRR